MSCLSDCRDLGFIPVQGDKQEGGCEQWHGVLRNSAHRWQCASSMAYHSVVLLGGGGGFDDDGHGYGWLIGVLSWYFF